MNSSNPINPTNPSNSSNSMNTSNSFILFTIDVEDWFQVENFKQHIPFSSWSSYELRVEKNTHRILNLLDSIKLSNPTNPINPTNPSNPINPINPSNPANPSNPNNPKVTFFLLGWLAERIPNLVREIYSRGHEVASHGYYHNLGNESSSDDLGKDLIDSKKLLEDIIGDRVYGYRAPSFSINVDMLKIIEDCGYLYDSSYNSFSIHGRYGQVNFSQNDRKGIAIQISKIQNPWPRPDSNGHSSADVASEKLLRYQLYPSKSRSPLRGVVPYGTESRRRLRAGGQDGPKSKIFYELPISNIKLGNRTIPWGGGGYFRLIPFPLFRFGVETILKKEKAYLFYMHPWEVDPEQPRVTEASAFHKFRHYVNLKKTYSKLVKFFETFNEYSFITCHQYLEEMNIELLPNNE